MDQAVRHGAGNPTSNAGNSVMAAGLRPSHFSLLAPSRYRLRPAQMVRSWRRPIMPTIGPANRAGPVSVTFQSRRSECRQVRVAM